MKQIDGKVSVTVGTGDTAKEFERPVTYSVLETAEDVLALAQDEAKLKELISAANYGFNLQARSAVRQAILNESAGPDRALEQMIKQIKKSREAVGKPVTEAVATQMAKMALGIEDAPVTA